MIIVIIGTWAIRRRSRRKLHAEAAELSTEDLVGGGHGFDDIEKGTQGMFKQKDVLDRVEAATVHRVATNRSTGTTTTETYVQSNDGHGYGFSKMGYGDTQDFVLPMVQEQGPLVIPGNPYYDGREYLDTENNVSAHNRFSGPYLPNPFENAESNRAPTSAYDITAVPPVTPSGQVNESRYKPTSARKPTPPFLTVDVSATSVSMIGPESAVSLTASPMQLTDPMNPANPAPSPPLAESPRSTRMRRSSLLEFRVREGVPSLHR